jgi:hypothetical protein
VVTLSGVLRKRMARQPKPGLSRLEEHPLSFPARALAPQG